MILPSLYAISGNEENLEILSKMILSKKEGDLSQIRAKTRTLTELKTVLSASIKGTVMINSSSFDGSDIFPFSGIHLTSKDLMNISLVKEIRKKGARLVSASCHNEKEIEAANLANCDFITISPVNTPSCHPDTAPIGWQRFSQLVAKAEMPVYALGGQRVSDLVITRNFGGYGIAGISDFWG